MNSLSAPTAVLLTSLLGAASTVVSLSFAGLFSPEIGLGAYFVRKEASDYPVFSFSGAGATDGGSIILSYGLET